MNATTQQIPRGQWQHFFENMGTTYAGWSASIEVMDPNLGDQPAETGLPFQGISFEQAGSDAGNILIETGDTEANFFAHHIDHPRAVRVTQSQPGAEVDVEIESEDEGTTLLRLRPRGELEG